MNSVKNYLIIKKCLRLVAEKFSFSTNYLNETISISNNSIRISIEPKRDKNNTISYENLNQLENLTVSIDELFDIVIQSLKFDRKDKISRRKGEIITLENWIHEEQISLKEIEKTLFDLKENNVTLYEFRGNRIIAEYYQGIIILSDDLGYYKSGIIIT